MNDFNFYFTRLKKSIDNNRLEYFKKELFKILTDQEKKELYKDSKNLDQIEKSMIKTLIDVYGIEKGASYPVGTVREWKGEKFRKIAPGKWRKIYDSHSRGALQSIRIIKKKIIAAKDTDTLLQLVMENVNRFQDANGNLLPIVEELKAEVNKKKAELNAGKPSTQEQIDDFKKKNAKTPYQRLVEPDINKADDLRQKYNEYFEYKFKDNDEKYKQGNALLSKMKEHKEALNKLQNSFWKNELDISGDEFDVLQIAVSRLNTDIYMFENNLKTLNERIENDKLENDIKNSDISNLTDKDWEGMKQFQDKIDLIINSDKNLYYIREDVRELIKNPAEADKKWLKMHNISNFDELYAHVYDKITERARAKQKAEKEAKIKARNEKIKEINEANNKTYTDQEIQKAFKLMETLQKDELNDLVYNIDWLNKKIYMAYQNMENRRVEIANMNRSLDWDHKIRTSDDKEYMDYRNDWENFKIEKNGFLEDLKQVEDKVDNLMDPIAYYYLHLDYEKDPKIDTCQTTSDVINLIKSKDWFSDQGKNRLDISKLDLEATKDMYKVLERTFAIFPEQKGKDYSLGTMYENSRTWARGGYKGIYFNTKYWKKYDELKESYKSCEGGFHPMGTSAKDIIYHEYYHVMTVGALAKKIKENVTKRLKMRGKKGGPKQDELIQYGVSEYALKDADEFGAECFCQALGSEAPTAFAKEVFKETLKYKKYMRGIGGIK